jgi:uncharacterized protein YbjT (DUF2867 family)
MMILVTGATGFVGRNVVRQLLDAGVHVRALTRNPATAALPDGVEVVEGDLTRPETLAPALAGVERMYLFPAARSLRSEHDDRETAREVVAMAKRAGVRRIVDLSAASVTVGLHTNPVEQVVEESGLEWTHVRPGGFMANMLQLWAPMIREQRVVRYPFADEPANMIHEVDIAAVAVAALLEDGHHGAAYTLTGPGTTTTREQVAAIAEALGEPVRYIEVTREEARGILKAQGGSPPRAPTSCSASWTTAARRPRARRATPTRTGRRWRRSGRTWSGSPGGARAVSPSGPATMFRTSDRQLVTQPRAYQRKLRGT